MRRFWLLSSIVAAILAIILAGAWMFGTPAHVAYVGAIIYGFLFGWCAAWLANRWYNLMNTDL